jgi:tetratricopeptide (TPR) repeat protein
MRLSLCLIARDEERFLDGCLASVHGAVDEIVVVDTGSKDATADIARSHGARVLHEAWRDDFSAARNTSLAAARGDFALVLDADERLAGGDLRAAVADLAHRHGGACGRVALTNEPMGTRVLITRVVPLDGRHRFAGRVHEQVLRDGEEPQRVALDVHVRHLGYAPDVVRERNKAARNAALLALDAADRPNDAYVAYQLGRTLFAAGRTREAHLHLERATSLVEPSAPYAAHLVETLAYVLRALGRATEALRLVEPLAATFDERSDTQFVAALLAMDLGHVERARRGFLRCLELDGHVPPGGEHDPATATLAPAHNLGVMAEVLGPRDEARIWYERALAYAPNHANSRAGLARVSAASAA